MCSISNVKHIIVSTNTLFISEYHAFLVTPRFTLFCREIRFFLNYALLGVKFWAKKYCPCNKNDKYEVWVKTILTNMNIQKSYRHIRPKKVKYLIPEIPDDSEKKSGTDWVLPKIIGSGIGYPLVPGRIISTDAKKCFCLREPFFYAVFS